MQSIILIYLHSLARKQRITLQPAHHLHVCRCALMSLDVPCMSLDVARLLISTQPHFKVTATYMYICADKGKKADLT